MKKEGASGVSFSLRLKLTLTFLVIGAIVSGFLSVSMYRILSNRLFEELQKRLLTVSTLGADLVDRAAVERLVSKLGPDLPADKVAAIESAPDFLAVSKTLNDIRAVDPALIRYVYLFRPTGDPNSDVYVVDADVVEDNRKVAAGDTNVGDISHFASAFDVSDFPMARQAATQRAPLTETTYSYDPDFKVNSLSGYAQIFAADGRTLVGVVGVDMVDTDARAILVNALRIALIVIGAALALTIIASILLGTLFTRGIISLDEVVRRFDKSNLDVRADIHSRDEVGRLGHSFNVMADTVKSYSLQLEGLLTAYGRFVPRDFLTQLGKGSIVDVKLGDMVQQEMAVLFSDIRSFTSLSESMTPEQNFKFLNSYLERMGPEIRANGGFIDKYIGDAIMALFSGGPESGLRAAIAMQKKLVEYNMHRGRSGYDPISIGVGVHSGTLMLGTLGEHERMDGSVISDAVNLASRLEGLTKMYGAAILTTGQTVSKLADPKAFNLRFIDRVRVKGRKETVMIFELLDGANEDDMERKLEYRGEFAQALRTYYAKGFKDALGVFTDLRKRNPLDPVLSIYVKRTRLLAELGAPAGWEGVEVLEMK
jgi:class 3 adenylate cyclase/HAMP domain-containing protein